jgi:hypothetical protein
MTQLVCTTGHHILPKRIQTDLDSEAVNLFFERLFAVANTSQPTDDNTLSILKKLKLQVLSAAAEEECIRKAAKEFTLDEAVQNFGLTYGPGLGDTAKHQW